MNAYLWQRLGMIDDRMYIISDEFDSIFIKGYLERFEVGISDVSFEFDTFLSKLPILYL